MSRKLDMSSILGKQDSWIPRLADSQHIERAAGAVIERGDAGFDFGEGLRTVSKPKRR